MKRTGKDIYIMLTDTGSWLNRLVKRYTDAPYNHVSIGFDDGLEHLYSFGRKKPRNPFYGGFVKEDVVEGTYRYFPNTTCVIYRMTVSDKEWKRMRSFVRKFERKKSLYRYNFLGLLTMVVDKPLKRKKAYFCSQFVAEVLKRAGIHVFEKDTALVKPEDFQSIPGLEVVYEGKLYEYKKVLDKLEDAFETKPFSRYHFFVKPIRKTVRFVNPMYYYQQAVDRYGENPDTKK